MNHNRKKLKAMLNEKGVKAEIFKDLNNDMFYAVCSDGDFTRHFLTLNECEERLLQWGFVNTE